MPLPTLFEVCEPRDDVLRGSIRDSDFAADLAQVLRGQAPPEYQDAKTFFANTHPTAGLKALLKNVCQRLTGTGGEASAIFRLDTQYGGGKTHSLIALAHAAAGMKGVVGVEEFLDPKLVPKKPVRVAAFDGENADPVNGRSLEGTLRAFTPWGEIAYALGGEKGFERLAKSDRERVAPGAETISELFAGKPVLILLDELSIYLRKVHGRPEAAQLTPFLNSLFKAVDSSSGAVLVFTLAVGKSGVATDAYSEENQFLADRLAEAESVAARKATLIDPTAEGETAQVLRRRLFKKIDEARAADVVEAYREIWAQQSSLLPEADVKEDRLEELRNGYPFHPELISLLTNKLSTLSNFQRVRGMLRLLTQAVSRVWGKRAAGTYALHVHHLDPGFSPTHNEIVTRLELTSYDPAIRNDVASGDGSFPALAERLDAQSFVGVPPFGSQVARTILWNSFAFNENLKGLSKEELRYAILTPDIDPGFIDSAREKFVAESAYLDDRPTAPLRFLTDANLNQVIAQKQRQVDRGEARAELDDTIRTLFRGKRFQVVSFPASPQDVPDEVGDGRPLLVLLGYHAEAIRPSSRLQIPSLVEKIFRERNAQGDFRQLQNNLVFLVAEEELNERMLAAVIRRLALEALNQPEQLNQLSEHQRRKAQELFRKSEQEVAVAIQQGYRHLFFPSRNQRVEEALVDLAHNAFEIHSASERPGDGQRQVERALVDSEKLRRDEDLPPSPAWVRDQTPLKKGQITTADLRNEFRKDPRLPILLGDEVLRALVRRGVEDSIYVYKSGDLLYGKGDPAAAIQIDQNSFVFTREYAERQGLWPRRVAAAQPPSGGGGAAVYPPGGGSPGETAEPKTGGRRFQAEGPLREALTRLWEQVRDARVDALQLVRLRLFDSQDAFRLLSVVAKVSGAEKMVRLEGRYETATGSHLDLEFSGRADDAQPVKEFLDAQFKAASEKDLKVTYELTFAGGLSLSSDQPEKLTDQLVRFATGAAYVEAEAESAVESAKTAAS
jgi:Protein of unknown function (DUF499)